MPFSRGSQVPGIFKQNPMEPDTFCDDENNEFVCGMHTSELEVHR